jgi:predicted house-cleaning noncanonical NTP pyrophosphatase (MazG superfamily)
MTKYNKLVRDSIPEIIRSRGGDCSFHIADDKEYEVKLFEKLVEEVAEVQKDRNAEEIADLLEVIDAVIEYKNFDRAEIEQIKKAKFEKRGGFAKRIILDES